MAAAPEATVVPPQEQPSTKEHCPTMPSIEATLLATSPPLGARPTDQYDYIAPTAATFTEDGRLALADEEGSVRLSDTAGDGLTAVVVGTFAAGDGWALDGITLRWDRHP